MNFSHMEFAWLALALPALAAALYAGHKLRLQAKQVYGSENVLERFHKAKRSRTEWLHPLGIFVIGCLAVICAMGPIANTTRERVPDGSVQAIVVLDVSKSMAAEDYRECMPKDAGPKPDLNEPWGSRLDMAKYQILQIMKAVQGNQLGIVNYAEKGFPQADLTTDFVALRFVLKYWVVQGNAPGYGSHYDNGLKEALATFKRDEDPKKEKVIILMSDGGFDGDPEELAKVVEEINKQGIKVVIVGVGMPGQNAIPVYDNGKLTGYLTVDGQTVTTSYEEDHLRQLAAATHGTYQHIEASVNGTSQKIAIDWGQQIGGSRIELRGTPLFPYFGGAAFAIAVLLSVSAFKRKKD
jgi:hypothetical protein